MAGWGLIFLELNDEEFMIQPFVWAHTFLRFADGDATNLLLNTRAIPAVAVYKQYVREWFK